MQRRFLGALVVVNLMVASSYLAVRQFDGEPARALADTTTSTSSTTSTTSTTTTVPPTTTTVPPTTTTTSPAPAIPVRLLPFVGLGTWVDVFDFSPSYMQEGESTPVVTPATVDTMAAQGVHTLYIQAARDDPRTPGELESPGLLAQFLVRAHARGMHVVAWYLPKQFDDADLARLRAIRDFSASGEHFDAIGVDIEFRAGVPDVAQRNARLVDLSRRLRAQAPDTPLAAIVLPPVVTDIISPDYWPDFPWGDLASIYDAWMPMTYWTNRKVGTEWRDPRNYTERNIALVRRHLGDDAAPVHAVGGIGDAAAPSDYEGFIAAARATGSIGASVYDFRTTVASAWPVLRGSPGE